MTQGVANIEEIEAPLREPSAHASADGGGGGGMQDILDKPWADKREFPLDFLAVVLIGCAMGALSYPYSWVVDKVPDWWLDKTGPEGLMHKASTVEFGAGSPIWIPICWLGATLVGVLKVLLRLDTYPSFITELKHQECDPITSVKVFVCCIASLCVGATLGLEAGLGSVGAALGHVSAKAAGCFCRRASQDPEIVDLRRRTYILSGIAAAFGAILPAPWISALLVAEIASLGTEQHALEGEFMAGRKLPKKVLVFVVPAATAAFAVRYCLEPLKPVEHPGYLLPYDNLSAVYGLGLGVVAAVVGFMFLAISILTKVSLSALSAIIERRCGKAARQIILASVGGAVTGVGLYLFPLVFSSGKSAMKPTLDLAPELSTWLLVGTALVKCLTFWAGFNAGLVGGLFFPLMYVGLVAGVVCARVFGLPSGMTVPVMLGAVPGSLVAAPLTMLSFPVGMFVMGPLQTVPIFVAIVTANTLLVGTGFLQGLAKRRGGGA